MSKRDYCHNCHDDNLNGGMDSGYYRDWQGCKHDASLFPICKECIDAGHLEPEDHVDGTIQQLYLGSSRSYELKCEKREWEDRMNGFGGFRKI